MKSLTRILIALALILTPVVAGAQTGALTVKSQGNKLTIKDFARAFLSQYESGTLERKALSAFLQGTSQSGNVECITDVKNGYFKYAAKQDGALETIEMCYWNCDNKNEKLVAVNRISNAMGMDESYITFFRYNAKTRKMKVIEPPFDRIPEAADIIDQDKADQATADMVLNSQNEDAVRFMPCYQLPRTGKDITYRIADTTAIPRTMQREGTLHWTGSDFTIE